MTPSELGAKLYVPGVTAGTLRRLNMILELNPYRVIMVKYVKKPPAVAIYPICP